MDEKTLRKHREKLDKALAANRDEEAIQLLAGLVSAEPTNARWPHKRGDLLRKVGRRGEAVAAYEQAVDVYAKAGFIARAVAMAKTVLSLDPSRTDVLLRVDPLAAQQLHRQARPASILPGAMRSDTNPGARGNTNPGAGHPAVVPDQPQPSAAPAVRRHPMVLDEDPAPQGSGAEHHPMIIGDDEPTEDVEQVHPRVVEADPEDELPVVIEDSVVAPPPARHPMVVEAAPVEARPKQHPMVLDDESPPPWRPQSAAGLAPPAAHALPSPPPPSRGRAAPPPPSAASRPRAAPPPVPSAVRAKPPGTAEAPGLTLDRLSLPPPRPAPAGAAAASTAAMPAAIGVGTAPGPAKPAPLGAPSNVSRQAGVPAAPAPIAPPRTRAAAPARPVASAANLPDSARAAASGAATSAGRVSEPLGSSDNSNAGQLWADRSSGAELPVAPAASLQPPVRNRGATMSGAGPKIKPYEPPPDDAELFSRALEAAIELTVAPDAKPNETRFSNAPPGPGVELSEAEVSERPESAIHEEHDAVPRAAGELSNLPLFPLFAEMPQEVLAAMIMDTELIELSDGDLVMRKGDPGDALYGIVEGSVAVAVPHHAHELTLAEGDVFGESCLLQDEPRHADVRVIGRLTALRIPRETLTRTLRSYPKLAELLLELLTRRLLGTLLQTSPLFSEFDAEGRRELSRMFEVRRARAGTKLAIAGKLMDGLYISLTGTLLVESPGDEPWIAPAGCMFGQHTLLSGEPSASSVTTRVNLVVLRLPGPAFSVVAMQYPTVVVRLSELSTGDVVSVGL